MYCKPSFPLPAQLRKHPLGNESHTYNNPFPLLENSEEVSIRGKDKVMPYMEIHDGLIYANG